MFEIKLKVPSMTRVFLICLTLPEIKIVKYINTTERVRLGKLIVNLLQRRRLRDGVERVMPMRCDNKMFLTTVLVKLS